MANIAFYDKKIFAHNLRYLLEKNHEKQTDLASLLGVSKSTVSCYCSGEQMPRFDKLKMISEHFDVPIASLIELKGPIEDKELTQTEKSLALRAAAGESEPSPIETIMSRLNLEGQDELIRYGWELCDTDKYKNSGILTLSYIKHYLVPAAAGYASPIQGEDYELIPLDSGAPRGADFCITIQGDSMEPYISDGSLVYVKRDVPLEEFEVGVFYVDGDVYCKQWCRDYSGTLHLLSANSRRKDANITIARDSGRSCICFGKVLLGRRLPRPEYYN